METRIYVDGRITAPEAAVVPVLDRGFLYGDSVYEVMWWHRGVLVQEAEHLARLRESGQRTYLEVPFEDRALLAAVAETCAAAGAGPEDDAYVRLMVTRGAGPLGLEVTDAPARLVVIVAPARRPTPKVFERGLTAAVVGRRRNPSLALDPRAKTGNYLNNVLALHEARLAGADDGIMLNEHGHVAEATTSNVYLIVDGGLVTPSLEAGILKGTTRTRILALCAANDIGAKEDSVPLEMLTSAAAEVFLSSSVKGIRPVLAIDGVPVGDGTPGPLTRRIRDLFERAADEEAARAVRGVREDGGEAP